MRYLNLDVLTHCPVLSSSQHPKMNMTGNDLWITKVMWKITNCWAVFRMTYWVLQSKNPYFLAPYHQKNSAMKLSFLLMPPPSCLGSELVSSVMRMRKINFQKKRFKVPYITEVSSMIHWGVGRNFNVYIYSHDL